MAPDEARFRVTRTGKLVLVVGPSGAGKDTLMRGARQLLAGDPAVVFPQREITREGKDQAEDFLPISPLQFDKRERDGRYALSWKAHGLAYGIPIAILDDLRSGRTVVLNVSRAVLSDAREMGWPVMVASVSASAANRRKRLAERGREASEDLVQRLHRRMGAISGDGVVEIQNDGQVDDGVRRLLEVIAA